MDKPNLTAIPENLYGNTGNMLIDIGGTRADALDNMHDFAQYLAGTAAHDPGDMPGPSIRHGRFLCLTLLADALGKLRDIEEAQEGGAA